MTLCPDCRDHEPKDFPDSTCVTCDGEGLVGDPNECTTDWPLCESRLFNGGGKPDDWKHCTCDNGIPARMDRLQAERDWKQMMYLLREAVERIEQGEQLIYSLMREPGVVAGLTIALEILGDAQADLTANLKPWQRTQGTNAGVNNAVMILRRRLQFARRAACEEANHERPDVLLDRRSLSVDAAGWALREQLDLFGVTP